MNATPPLFDLLLALGLTALALGCLFDRHLVRACIVFVGFALSMALAWWQLGAPWLALAEFSLGAGLTGCSLFYALGVLPPGSPLPPRRDWFREPFRQAAIRAVLALAWMGMIGTALRHSVPVMAYSPIQQPLLLAGVAMSALGLGAFALHRHLLRRLLAFNVLGSGVFLLLAGLTGTVAQAQALIITGLGVAWLGTLLGAMLIRRLYHLQGAKALISDNESLRQKRSGP